MMANADKVAAEANAAAIAEDVGIVQGASADALGIGAGAAETLDGDTNDLCGMGARTSRSGKIKVHVASKSTVALYVVLSVLAAITVFALVVMDYGKVSFPAAMAAAVEDFVTMMTQPGLGGHFTLPDVIEGLFVSLALALLTTFIGAVIAFVLGLLAACNLSSQGMSNAIKVFMSVARALPTILWVLVFSVAIGLGPELTAKAARQASLGAGAKVIKTYSYELTEGDLQEIDQINPDICLLTGGTDGGNKENNVFNAQMLATAKNDFPIIIAGNRNCADKCQEILKDKQTYVCENVMPRLDIPNVEPVQKKIREIFLEQIVKAKGLSRAQDLIQGILMPTPSAMLTAMKLLAKGSQNEDGLGDLVGVALGGATTDVYSLSFGPPTMGMTAPVQAACMMRPSKSTQKFGATAAARLPAVNTDSAVMNSWRVVKRPTR